MMRKIIYVLTILLLLCLVGCKANKSTEDISVASNVIDRDEFITTNGNEDINVNISSINKFIESYNKDAVNKIEDYKIYQDEDNYIVVDNKNNKYFVTLDKNGKVTAFELSNGEILDKINVFDKGIDVVWDDNFIPSDVNEYKSIINNKISQLKIELEEYKSNSPNIDTTMPTYDELKEKIDKISDKITENLTDFN